MVLEHKGQHEALDNLEILPFKHKHYELLLEMLKDQGYTQEVSYQSLPKIGYIAMLGKQPVFAGFLRKVEGGEMAQFDGFTSNPYFGSQIRDKAINEVINRLMIEAKDLKLKGIYAFTNVYSILLRAEAIGFKRLDHSVIALSLRS